MGVVPACMSLHLMCASALRGQKRVLDPLGLVLELVVSHHMNAGFSLEEEPLDIEPTLPSNPINSLGVDYFNV